MARYVSNGAETGDALSEQGFRANATTFDFEQNQSALPRFVLPVLCSSGFESPCCCIVYHRPDLAKTYRLIAQRVLTCSTGVTRQSNCGQPAQAPPTVQNPLECRQVR